jgi:hypothetical protein
MRCDGHSRLRACWQVFVHLGQWLINATQTGKGKLDSETECEFINNLCTTSCADDCDRILQLLTQNEGPPASRCENALVVGEQAWHRSLIDDMSSKSVSQRVPLVE